MESGVAGSWVKFTCDRPGIEMLQLVSNAEAAGSYELEIKSWTQRDLEGAVAIIADVADDAAPYLFDTSKLHTPLVNIIDKPKFCTFQFGSIVNAGYGSI